MRKRRTQSEIEIRRQRRKIKALERKLSEFKDSSDPAGIRLIDQILHRDEMLGDLLSAKKRYPESMSWITDRLNVAVTTPDVQRVTEFLKLAIEAEELRASVERAMLPNAYHASPMIRSIWPAGFKDKEAQRKAERYRDVVAKLEGFLKAYKWTILVNADADTVRVTYTKAEGPETDSWESEAVTTILSLLEIHDTGLTAVTRFRRCKYAGCCNWFFCRSRKALFCTPRCRYDFHNKTEEARKRKASAAQTRRADEQERYAGQPKGSGLRVLSQAAASAKKGSATKVRAAIPTLTGSASGRGFPNTTQGNPRADRKRIPQN